MNKSRHASDLGKNLRRRRWVFQIQSHMPERLMLERNGPTCDAAHAPSIGQKPLGNGKADAGTSSGDKRVRGWV